MRNRQCKDHRHGHLRTHDQVFSQTRAFMCSLNIGDTWQTTLFQKLANNELWTNFRMPLKNKIKLFCNTAMLNYLKASSDFFYKTAELCNCHRDHTTVKNYVAPPLLSSYFTIATTHSLPNLAFKTRDWSFTTTILSYF